MKTDDARRNATATTQCGRLADFLFVGLGIVPAALLLGGHLDIAILLFVPLLITACLFGAWEQLETAGVGAAGPASKGERKTASPHRAAELTMRERAGPEQSRKP